MSDVEQGSGNVFADLGFADACGHRAKAELVRKLAQVIADRSLSQSAAARIVGVNQPDISRLLSGRFRDVSGRRLTLLLQLLNSEADIDVHYEGCRVG